MKFDPRPWRTRDSDHDDLVRRAVKWLKSAVYAKNPEPTGVLDKVWYKPACGVAVPELVSGNYGDIPDAFGWLRDQSWLIECKVSRADFRADFKKNRTGIGNRRCYLCPPELIGANDLPEGWGLLWCYPKSIKVIVWPKRWNDRQHVAELAMMYSLLRRVEKRGLLKRCLAPKWGGDGPTTVSTGGRNPSG